MPYSIYFHIPFCSHRCAYCDFNTYAGQETLIPAYVDGLCREMEVVAANLPALTPGPSPFGGGENISPIQSRVGDGVHTIFFGGGTPSLLTPQQFEQILSTCRDLFDILDMSDLETSLEANPGTVTPASLHRLRRAGFNRISFGVQSFDAGELRLLERIHDPQDVQDAAGWARQAGFANLNLDLIYGLPGQPLSRWQETLRCAVELAPEHLSLYALTIEPGTPFGRRVERGLLALPDPDLAADMYEAASDFLARQGYRQYEISNWARPGYECRHNLQYWRNLPYLGFGAGAHGCAGGIRYSNVLRIKNYIERVAGAAPHAWPLSPAAATHTALTSYVEMQETMMLGLRLTHEGVAAADFLARFGQALMTVFGREIDELLGLGLLEWAQTSEVLRLTPRGRLLGNQVFMRFVDG